MNYLDSIAVSAGTDKSSLKHNYCTKYEKYLPFKQDYPVRLLEIGVFSGSSIKMWSEFFSNAKCIVGADILPSCKVFENTSKNIFIETGSQTDETFLASIINKYKTFDLIIDDGSHQQADVIFTFNHLFNILPSGGVYVVEDSCCSYWEEFGGGLNKEDSSVSYFKTLVDHVSFFGQLLNISENRQYRRDDLHIQQITQNKSNIRTDIESINFMNSMIFITKR